MSELKPCPHCGFDGNPQVYQSLVHGSRFVKCEICKFAAPFAAWNTRAEPLPAGEDGELVDLFWRIKEKMPFHHEELLALAARIAALNAEVARKDEALAEAANQISDLARQLGEAQGKLEASELPGIVDGWREKCERLEAEVARLQEALIQHNDRLRSAQQIAFRDGNDTNWQAFRGQCTYTLAEYHDLTNKARLAALGDRHE